MSALTAGHIPWVGPTFRSSTRRVLLLGESHYVSNLAEDSPTLTCDILGAVRNGERHLGFYTKAADLVGNIATPAQSAKLAAFWDGVAFFNYVPVVVGQTSETEPTAAMWEQGHARFLALLADLAPTHVLSLGQRQWNHIHFPPGWSSVKAPGGSDPEVRRWTAPDGRGVTATWVNHPSSRGFSVAKWRDRVAALLAYTPPTAIDRVAPGA
jgi:hypothetical protein